MKTRIFNSLLLAVFMIVGLACSKEGSEDAKGVLGIREFKEFKEFQERMVQLFFLAMARLLKHWVTMGICT